MAAKTTRAIAVMLLAMFLFACMDALNKNLSQTYAITQILWVRFVFFLRLRARPCAAAHAAHGGDPVRAFWFQCARGIVLFGEIGTFPPLALHYLPLADVHALAAITRCVTALSVPILGERVECSAGGVGAAFIGVLIIVRQVSSIWTGASSSRLRARCSLRSIRIMLRIAARYDPPETTVPYSALVGSIVLTGIGPFAWTPPMRWTGCCC
jgi:hypothetical protein